MTDLTIKPDALTEPHVQEEPAEHLTVVQAGPFTAEQAAWLVDCFETPGHALNACLPAGVVVDLGYGEGVVSVILVSMTGEEGLPLSVAVAVSTFLSGAFIYSSESWYDTDRIVFVNAVPRAEHYLLNGLVVLALQDGTPTADLRRSS